MIERRLLARVSDRKAQLDTLRPLLAAALRRLRQQISVEMTYHSNAIEGNTLGLRETCLTLETEVVVEDSKSRESVSR